MSVFAYRGFASPGKTFRKGTIAADTPRAARDTLRSQGVKVERLVAVSSGRTSRSWSGSWYWHRLTAGRRRTRVSSFLGELATLLGVGVPLLEALDGFVRQPRRNGMGLSLTLLRDRVAAGSSMADAMAGDPMMFDNLTVSMVEVGERSGRLDQVLAQIAAFKRRSEQLKGKLGTALIYPAIVLIAGIAVSLFLMTFVVPRLLESLVEAGQSLPWTTRVVKAASDGLVHHGLVLGLGVLLGGLVVAAAARRPSVRRRWHAFLLKTPVLGEVLQKQAMLRIAVTLATLTRSGMQFTEAAGIVRQTMPNLIIRSALESCERAVGAGRDIAPALEATGVFPHAMIQVFAVGQASGRLDEMLERIAEDYDTQINVLTQRLVALLEPAMILLLALFVGGIVLAVIQPYMEAGNVM